MEPEVKQEEIKQIINEEQPKQIAKDIKELDEIKANEPDDKNIEINKKEEQIIKSNNIQVAESEPAKQINIQEESKIITKVEEKEVAQPNLFPKKEEKLETQEINKQDNEAKFEEKVDMPQSDSLSSKKEEKIPEEHVRKGKEHS